MEKWADYLISAVRYEDNHSRIDKVKTHEDLGDKVKNPPIQEEREEVVKKLHAHKTYCTIIKDKEKNEWKKGEKVAIFPLGDEEFIKTEKNNKKEDNLGDLPEF